MVRTEDEETNSTTCLHLERLYILVGNSKSNNYNTMHIQNIYMHKIFCEHNKRIYLILAVWERKDSASIEKNNLAFPEKFVTILKA